MSEYIKRSDAIKRQVIWQHFNGVEFLDDKAVPVAWIQSIPPANVKPVVRGKWMLVTNGRGGHECDQCCAYAPAYQSGSYYLSNFCPNCGADMRGGDAE